MPRTSQDGTKMWCPKCEKITVCKAVPTTQIVSRAGQRMFKTTHPDIHWFRRGRACKVCDHYFLTAEIDEDFLNELCNLRAALKDIRQNADTYSKESRKAGRSLKKLEATLKVLKLLKVAKSGRGQ